MVPLLWLKMAVNVHEAQLDVPGRLQTESGARGSDICQLAIIFFRHTGLGHTKESRWSAHQVVGGKQYVSFRVAANIGKRILQPAKSSRCHYGPKATEADMFQRQHGE